MDYSLQKIDPDSVCQINLLVYMYNIRFNGRIQNYLSKMSI